MKRDKENQTLTRVEMEIMNRLWAKESNSASVRELLAEYTAAIAADLKNFCLVQVI